MRIRIGDLLVKAGVITELQLKAALAEQQSWGGKLGDILVRMEFLTEEVLVRALSKQTGIPRADLNAEPDRAALKHVPAEVAEELNVVPVKFESEGRVLYMAMSDPMNLGVTDHLRSLTKCKIEAHLAGASAIRAAISRWYHGEELREEESSAMRIVNNAGKTVAKLDSSKQRARAAAPATPAAAAPAREDAPANASDLLRGVEETQRRSVAALKAMVELLIEKGVFSRDEYLARVKR